MLIFWIWYKWRIIRENVDVFDLKNSKKYRVSADIFNLAKVNKYVSKCSNFGSGIIEKKYIGNLDMLDMGKLNRKNQCIYFERGKRDEICEEIG